MLQFSRSQSCVLEMCGHAYADATAQKMIQKEIKKAFQSCTALSRDSPALGE
jgi:hypothetical protein